VIIQLEREQVKKANAKKHLSKGKEGRETKRTVKETEMEK
jgi:hypothetical protein